MQRQSDPARCDRRRWLQACAALLAGLAAGPVAGRDGRADSLRGRIRKAVGYTMIQEDLSVEDKLRLVRDLGFEGIEVPTSYLGRNTPEPKVLAQASRKVGVPIHGVTHSSRPDLEAAIDEAALYGATSVLHVVRADPNGSYLDNYRRTQEIIRRAIRHAERKNVQILIENVWATFLIEPLTMARYIDELDSPFVRAYFDVGNVLRWGWPHHWIEVLGRRIAKIHVKEFDLNLAMEKGMRHAFDVPMGEGSVPWEKVRRQLAAIDYRGWATAEMPGGDRRRLAEISRQMDRVLAL